MRYRRDSSSGDDAAACGGANVTTLVVALEAYCHLDGCAWSAFSPDDDSYELTFGAPLLLNCIDLDRTARNWTTCARLPPECPVRLALEMHDNGAGNITAAAAAVAALPVNELKLDGRWREDNVAVLARALGARLQLLSARGCGLDTLTARVTAALPELVLLSVPDNAMAALGPDAMAPLAKLEHADLASNGLRDLDAQSKWALRRTG